MSGAEPVGEPDEDCDSCFGQGCQFCCSREVHDQCFCHCTPRDTDLLVMGPPLKTEAEWRAGWLAELGSDENVERVARALCGSDFRVDEVQGDESAYVDKHWRLFIPDARAVLGALTEAGES